MYSDIIFNSLSIMCEREVECASSMTTNCLLTNKCSELDDTPLAGVFGEYRDEDMTANVATFAVACHILQINSLFKTSIGSMSGTASKPRKDANTLFTINPSIIDLGLNLDANISILASNQRGVTPEH